VTADQRRHVFAIRVAIAASAVVILIDLAWELVP
jgi:hypothetical protein